MPTAPRNATIRVDGLDELRRELRRTGDKELPKQLREANHAVSKRLAEAAALKAPVRTGRLRASVRGLAAQRDATVKAGTARVPYAAAVHWGTGPRPGQRGPHNIARRPFIYEAAERMRDELADEYESIIEDMFRELR